jgi:nitroimidazol reductase NimA-like FMN-containing flavoprotein (pyridoxamine 5'-phosphate oxidase superfamily)
MPGKPARPSTRDLSEDEIEALLKRNHVGRIAFSFHDQPDVRPVHYVFENGWLFGRTSLGNKLETLRHNQWVAFEVDEVEGPFDWQSAIVRGGFYRFDRDGNEYDVRLYARGLELIRKIVPETLTDQDPTPFRTELFGIKMDSATGRSCSTKEA